jgi:hypothetical protein
MMRRNFISRILLTFAVVLLPWTAMAEEKIGECGVCGGPITESSNLFVITGADGKEQPYGCPGCGLSVLAKMEDTAAHGNAKAQDFLRRTMVDARQAWYLRGSEVGYCCQPSWLAFGTKGEAEKFARGFGGEVMDFAAAMKQAEQDHAQHVHEMQVQE